jgi:hypothetical protein
MRVMSELVDPFRDIQMDDTEFACLKAIVFFDPNARGLTDPDRIRRLRHQIQVRHRDSILKTPKNKKICLSILTVLNVNKIIKHQRKVVTMVN